MECRKVRTPQRSWNPRLSLKATDNGVALLNWLRPEAVACGLGKALLSTVNGNVCSAGRYICETADRISIKFGTGCAHKMFLN